MEYNGSIKVAEGVNLELVAERMYGKNTKKPAKKGGFMLFVEENLERWRNEGKDVSTKPKMIIEGDIEWRKLSDRDKARYKEGAKPKNERSPVPIILLKEDNHAPLVETKKVRSSIKQLSIIYEEDEIEDSISSEIMECSNNTSSISNHIPSTSSNDIKHPQLVHHSNAKHLKYPLRRPREESLMAKRKLNFTSSAERENTSNEMSWDKLYSPNSTTDYIKIKSSSPIKNGTQSTSCDISPIKAEICGSDTWNFTLTEEKSRIDKIIKQVNEVMDDSLWNIGY